MSLVPLYSHSDSFQVSVAFSLFLSHHFCIFPWLWYFLSSSQDPVSMVIGCLCHCLASALQKLAVCWARCQGFLFAGANVLYTGELLNPWLTRSSVCSSVNLTPDFWICLALYCRQICNKLFEYFCWKLHNNVYCRHLQDFYRIYITAA